MGKTSVRSDITNMPQSPPVVCFTENHARRIFTRVMAPPVCFGSDCRAVLMCCVCLLLHTGLSSVQMAVCFRTAEAVRKPDEQDEQKHICANWWTQTWLSRALHPSTSHSLFVTTWIYLNKLPVTSSVAVCIRLVLIFFEPNTIVDMNKWLLSTKY